MKKYMPLNGLRWSRDSDSALCGTPPTDVLGQAGGGKTKIATRPEMISIPQISENASIASIIFRNKHLGWKSYRMEIKIK